MDDLAAADVFQVNFGGGEPFLRDDFLDVVTYAQSKGITTCVSTNGTLLDDDLAERLAAMDGLFLQVSLDGATSGTNDAIRGAGTFARILDGVECLRRHAVRDFSLNMVVTRVNVHEVAEFARLAARLDAKTRLSRFRPSGAGCCLLGGLPPDEGAAPGALGVPGRAHGDPHRRLLLLADAREPAPHGPHDVRRRADDHGRRARRQRVSRARSSPTRRSWRGTPRWTRRSPSSASPRCSPGSAPTTTPRAAGARASRCAMEAARRSPTSSRRSLDAGDPECLMAALGAGV